MESESKMTNEVNLNKMNKLNDKHGDALRRKMDEWAKVNRPDPLVIKMQDYKERKEIKPLIAPEFRDNPDAVRYAMAWNKEGVPFVEINDRLEELEREVRAELCNTDADIELEESPKKPARDMYGDKLSTDIDYYMDM